MAPVSSIQYMVDAFKKRRDLVLDLLNKIEGFKVNVPEGAFYVFPDISYYFGKTLKGQLINNASDFALFLLEHAQVATLSLARPAPCQPQSQPSASLIVHIA